MLKRSPERYSTLRDAITKSVRRGLTWPRGAKGGGGSSERQIWALEDVNFEVQRGEVIGVIGRNGAGKSTLLKVLSRICEPTEGFAEIRGRVGSLLEVGAGFHQELSGRENVYLNGAISGMKKGEIDKRFDEIVSFAELEGFVDTSVKHYSSGMYMRLAFAVAAHLEAEILFVDEVLAVGDAAFQKKCIGRMNAVASAGRTVLFVSHNMGAVRDLCRRGIWLDKGAVVADGDVNSVVQQYMGTMMEGSFQHVNKDLGFAIEDVVVKNGAGERTAHFRPGDDLVVEMTYDASKPIAKPYAWIAIQCLQGRCFTANMQLDGHRPEILSGRGVLGCRFKSIPLLPQTYSLIMCLRTGDGKDALLPPQEVASFDVDGDVKEFGFESELFHRRMPNSFPVVVPYEWSLPDGTTASVAITSAAESLVRG